jgi:hypothetical protein
MDTIKKDLVKSGFSEEQAKAIINVMVTDDKLDTALTRATSETLWVTGLFLCVLFLALKFIN